MKAIGRANLTIVLLLNVAACTVRSSPENPGRAGPPLDLALKSIRESFAAGDFETAELRSRALLETPRETRETLEILRQIGRCFQEQRRFAKARDAFEKALALPLDHDPRIAWSYDMNMKGWAQIGIAECYEAEGCLDEALHAYLESHLKYPVRGGCGNGNWGQRQRELDSIARCIRRIEEE